MGDATETTKAPAPAPAETAKAPAATETTKAEAAKAPKAKAPAKAGFFSQPDAASGAPSTNLEIAAPSGGQIALTAHNNGDGTWAVTRGPGGTILADGLAKEQAIAIVGAPTDGTEPRDKQEAWAIEARRELEEKAADAEVNGMFVSDAEQTKADKEAA